jgi:hypothetical protein
MDNWSIGASIATMATGVSAITAAYVWVRKQIGERRDRKDAVRLRNWNGYIDIHGINNWYVEVQQPGHDEYSAVVVLTVIDRKGNPSPSMANVMRQVISRDGMVCRVPSPDQSAFLAAQRSQRGYGQGGAPVL